jgi:hypothetical protein
VSEGSEGGEGNDEGDHDDEERYILFPLKELYNELMSRPGIVVPSPNGDGTSVEVSLESMFLCMLARVATAVFGDRLAVKPVDEDEAVNVDDKTSLLPLPKHLRVTEWGMNGLDVAEVVVSSAVFGWRSVVLSTFRDGLLETLWTELCKFTLVVQDGLIVVCTSEGDDDLLDDDLLAEVAFLRRVYPGSNVKLRNGHGAECDFTDLFCDLEWLEDFNVSCPRENLFEYGCMHWHTHLVLATLLLSDCEETEDVSGGAGGVSGGRALARKRRAFNEGFAIFLHACRVVMQGRGDGVDLTSLADIFLRGVGRAESAWYSTVEVLAVAVDWMLEVVDTHLSTLSHVARSQWRTFVTDMLTYVADKASQPVLCETWSSKDVWVPWLHSAMYVLPWLSITRFPGDVDHEEAMIKLATSIGKVIRSDVSLRPPIWNLRHMVMQCAKEDQARVETALRIPPTYPDAKKFGFGVGEG